MFTVNFFFFWGGDPRPRWKCALASLGQSLMRVKIGGAAPAKGRNVVSRKMKNVRLGESMPYTVHVIIQ